MNELMGYVEKFLYYEEVVIGKSYNTVKSYRKDLIQFITYLEENENIKNFNEVETMTFRSFIAFLNSDNKDGQKNKEVEKNISKRSINTKITPLRT